MLTAIGHTPIVLDMSIPTKARDLRPGDVITDFDGIRMYAAFDVQITEDAVTIFTAFIDQPRYAERIDIDLEDIVMVRERPGTVTCQECGQTHEAHYSHDGQYGEGPIYVVVCNGYEDFYTAEVVTV